MERLLSWPLLRHSRIARFILLVELLLVTLAYDVQASKLADFDPPQFQNSFEDELRWLQTEEDWSPVQAWVQQEFQKAPLPVSFLRQNEKVVWFRLKAVPSFSGRWLIYSPKVGIDRFTLFHRMGSEPWQSHDSREGLSGFGQNVFDTAHILELPQSGSQLLLKVQASSAVDTQLKLLRPARLLDIISSKRFTMGVLYTLFVVFMVLFCLAQVLTRTRQMYWLSLGALWLVGVVMALDGYLLYLAGLSDTVSSVRVIFCLLMLASASHLFFVCSRHLGKESQRGLLGSGFEFILCFIFLCLIVFLPLWGAGLALLVFVGLVGLGLMYAGRVQDMSRGDRLITNSSNLLIAVLSTLSVLHFCGLPILDLREGLAFRTLLVLVPTIWALGFSHFYRQLTVDYSHAHRESLGYQNQLQEAFESRLQIFSSIAHHLNNPLNYILLGVAKARDELGDVQRQVNTLFEHADQSEEAKSIQQRFDRAFENCRALFGDALFGVQRAARVVDEMRGLTSIDGDKSEFVPLDDILSSMRSRVEDDLGKKMIEPVSFKENVKEPGQYSIYGNPYLVIHALKNIVKNGYLFARRSSSVRPTLMIALDKDSPAGFIRLIVSNNGPAISVEHESSIFRMGFSSYGRRGTGLNVSQSILGENGGKVTLEDHGRDSGWVCFGILLPTEEVHKRSPQADAIV